MATKRAKRRRPQHVRVAPAAVRHFIRGERLELHRELGLKPWQASPLDVRPATDTESRTAWGQSLDKAREFREELERWAQEWQIHADETGS